MDPKWEEGPLRDEWKAGVNGPLPLHWPTTVAEVKSTVNSMSPAYSYGSHSFKAYAHRIWDENSMKKY